MATPMSAFLRAAASFTASPVIATTTPCSCMSVASRSLSCGATRPNTCSSGSRRLQLVVGQRGEVGAGDHARPETELVGDGLGRDGVVARDHADVDAGVQGGDDRRLRLGPQRVDDPDERHEDQLADLRLRIGLDGRGRRRAAAGTPAPAPAGPCSERPRLASSSSWRTRRRSSTSSPCQSAWALRSRTTSGAPLTTSTMRLAGVVLEAVERRHVLVGRVERHLGQARGLGAGSAPRRRRAWRRARPARPRWGRRRPRRRRCTVASLASTRAIARRSKSGAGPPATPQDAGPACE